MRPSDVIIVHVEYFVNVHINGICLQRIKGKKKTKKWINIIAIKW